MRSLLLLLLTASSLVTTTDAAAAMCDGMCEIDLRMDCVGALGLYEFAGDCCALTEVAGTCYMLTTDNCQYKEQGADDLSCSTDDQGNIIGCVPSYTVYYSTSEDPCPASDFFVPGFGSSFSETPSLTTVPVSDSPSLVPVSDGPTLADSQVPTVLTVDISGVETDVVAGAANLGDCFFVERSSYDTIFTNDCNDKILEYTYYNGGMDAEYEDTGYPQEVYARIRTHSRSCPDGTESCKVTVDGYTNTECACESDGERVTIGVADCAAAFPDVFADKGEAEETVKFFFGSGVGTYEEQFYPIVCEDCCEHELHATTVPSMAPSGTWVPIGGDGGASSAHMELIAGDLDRGDCFTVERYTEQETFSTDGCTATFLKFTYYNGGVNGDYEDTGYPKDEYLKVEIDAMHDCTDSVANPNHCSIKVYDSESIHTCNECAMDNGDIVMVDCADLPGVFAPEGEVPAKVQLMGSMDDGSMDYENAFFDLAFDQDKCLHPALGMTTVPSMAPTELVPVSYAPDSEIPSIIPTLVPISEVPSLTTSPYSETPSLGETSMYPSLGPSLEETSMYPGSEVPSLEQASTGPSSGIASSFAASDIVPGDPAMGDCYMVERYMTDTIYLDGCTDSFLTYTYYNGGLNGDYVDSGYPKEEYFDVQIRSMHDCDDSDAKPDTCSISVHTALGTTECNECSYNDGKVTMVDCSNLDPVFSPSSGQSVVLFFDGASTTYQEDFFSLTYNEDRCLHPSLVSSGGGPSSVPSTVGTASSSEVPSGYSSSPSIYPSLVPISEVPSLGETSLYPSGGPSGDDVMSSFAANDRVVGDAALGDCYTIDREMTDTFYSNGCTESSLSYTYFKGGMGTVVTDDITYLKVDVDVFHGCNDENNNPDSCSVSVEGIVGTCACLYSMGEVTMTTCTLFEEVLAPGSHSVEFFFDGAPESPYGEQFFPLAFDEARCHELEISEGPSMVPVSDAPSMDDTFISFSEVPSLVPVSDAPSMDGTSISFTEVPSFMDEELQDACAVPDESGISAVGIPTSPTQSFEDVLDGFDAGECYKVRRELTGMTQRGDADPDFYCCNTMEREYTYYNGGMDADGTDSGFPEDVIMTIAISVVRDCGDRDIPDVCTLSVNGVETCDCVYDSSGTVSIHDTSQVGAERSCLGTGVFSGDHWGPRDVVMFTTNLNDDETYFTPQPDPAWCEHPSYAVDTSDTKSGTESTTDKSFGENTTGKGADASDKTVTRSVDVTLHYFFKPGKGTNEPESSEISLLASQTLSYFHSLFVADPAFSDLFMNVKLVDSEHEFEIKDNGPNEFTLDLIVDVVLAKIENRPLPSTRDAAVVMAGSNLNRYLHQYVRKNPSGARNTFNDIQLVRLRGVGTENQTS